MGERMELPDLISALEDISETSDFPRVRHRCREAASTLRAQGEALAAALEAIRDHGYADYSRDGTTICRYCHEAGYRTTDRIEHAPNCLISILERPTREGGE